MPKVTLTSTGKESVRQARLEKELQKFEYTLQSEVASLPKHPAPVYREQTRVSYRIIYYRFWWRDRRTVVERGISNFAMNLKNGLID